MKAERWHQVEQLYHDALTRNVEERTAFIVAACGADDQLRREVESLLAYEAQAENFIESPALDAAAKIMAQKHEASSRVGQTINQYKITSSLGAGGMGEVYLADDTRLHRKVALKFLPEHLTEDKRHLHRFLQEARAVAALSHPNVCMIHEVVETGDDGHCLVMEFVDGVTLRQRLTESRLTINESLDAVIQVVSALSAAHALGIVHRDIKPENIMLRLDGYIKILDFGLAKLMEAKAERLDSENDTRFLDVKTTPGVVMGTVAYMSPEQARGLDVDLRTDIWSSGVVLYELLTGQQPFQGATPTDVIISIAEREPMLVSELEPGVPLGFDEIVKKALAKDREQRYQSAEDLLSELKRLRHELEVGIEDNLRPRGRSSSKTKTNGVPGSTRLSARFMPGRLFALGALAAVVLIAGLVYASFFRRSSQPIVQTQIRSLAVLPLENISGDVSQDYFADGMTESLITDLAKIAELRVISRPSVMKYKSVHKPLVEVGRELNVDAVLIGSVVRSGEQVRIGVQLIKADTEENLWTDSYEGNLRDVLELQREVTQAVVAKIKIKLSPQEEQRFGQVRPIAPEAYDQYLRGRFFLNRQTKEDNEAAIAALEKAVELDSQFAAAHAELAQAYSWKLFLFAPEENRWAEKAYVSAEKALALDPDLAVAHLARGRILWTPANHFPHEKAILEYRRAVALNPSLDEGRNQLALVYCHIGALEEALQESRKAIETNPNNNLAQLRVGQTLNFQGKYDQALATLQTLPEAANPALVGYQIAWALFNLGRKEEATLLLQKLLKDHPEDSGGLFTSVQAVLFASAGDERKAEEKINLAIQIGKGFGHFHHTAYHIACAYALMNKHEQAIKWLAVAADDGFPCYPLFARDKNLDNLRHDPHFATFLMQLRQKWETYKSDLKLM